MSFQKYDFVGVSSTQLPYVHDSFPPGQKIGSLRHYTMRSVYRGKDAKRKNEIELKDGSGSKQDMKELAELKLPIIDMTPRNESKNSKSTRLQGGNIYKQKAYFRLKGIPVRRMYTLNRTKSDKYEEETNRLDINSKRKSVSLTLLDLKDTDTKAESTVDESDYSQIDHSESPWTRVRLRELDSESPIPGLKSKKGKNGRKLGNIVSSRRLQQLLDNEDTLDPYSFYMY